MAEFEELITNWSRTVAFRPRQYFQPRSVGEVGDIVKAAVAAGRHVRAVGSAWSHSAAMRTDDVTVCLDLDQEPLLTKGPDFGGALGAALLPGVRAATGRDGLVWVHGGMKLHAVLSFLEAQGLGLWTMGSSAGQSVAGLLATGSHGGDFDRAPPVDYVRAMHLVGPDGEQWWIEPSEGFLRPDAMDGLLPHVAPSRRLRDDVAFRAAMVSVGSLGIVVGLVLQVRPRFSMVESFGHKPLEEALVGISSEGTWFQTPPVGSAIVDGVEGKYTHLELFVNLYPNRDGKREALVTTRFEAPRQPGNEGWRRQPRELSFGEKLKLFIQIKARSDHDYHDIVVDLAGLGRENVPHWVPSLAITNTGSGAAIPLTSIELAITTEGDRHVQLLRDLIRAFDEHHRDTGDDYAGFWSVRFTRPSRAHLAMQAPFGAPTNARVMHVEIFNLQALDIAKPGLSEPTQLEAQGETFVRKWLEIVRTAGARLHWGQWSSRDDLPDAGQYPEAESFRRGKRRLAEQASSLTVFDDDESARWGLTALHAGWAPSTCIPTAPSGAPRDTSALRRTPPGVIERGNETWIVGANGDGRMGVARLHHPPGQGPFWSRRIDRLGDHGARYATGCVAGAGSQPVIAVVLDDGKVRTSTSGAGAPSFGALQLVPGSDRFLPEGVAAAASNAGDVFLVGVTTSGALRWSRRPAGGAFSAWAALPGPNGDTYAGVPFAVTTANGFRAIVRGRSESYLVTHDGHAASIRNLGVFGTADPTAVVRQSRLLIAMPDAGGIQVGVEAADGTVVWEAPTFGFHVRANYAIASAVVGDETWLGAVDHDGFVRVIARRANGTYREVSSMRTAACGPVRLLVRDGGVVVVARVAHDMFATRKITTS